MWSGILVFPLLAVKFSENCGAQHPLFSIDADANSRRGIPE
uniref:Uncharacterized protein n=1 Tax=Ensifer adhaerens TaxID=106592 RepID=D1CSE5_ENSAD|nr:hypothetical protein [Ensifer adhaerens]